MRSSPSPTNDLYKLDLSSETDLYWTKLKLDNQHDDLQPSPRWQHSATKIDDKRIVIFGGFTMSAKEPRLNDTWVFDTVSEVWSKVVENSGDKNTIVDSVPHVSWNKQATISSPPCPRGSHSASLVDNFVVVFGGYGGTGYMRRDFSDLHALCLDNWQWLNLTTNGSTPKDRSGHKSVAFDSKLYVMGGWNTADQFDDVHVLDITTLSWSQIDTACGPHNWGPKRWNFAAVAAYAVPQWKIFIFGGNSGELDQFKPQGEHRNDVKVLESSTVGDSNENSYSWVNPKDFGDQPSPRSDTEISYSSEYGKLFLFGGWSNRWHGETYSCEVSSVVGPTYNIFHVTASGWKGAIGPVTGGSDIVIHGKGFLSGAGVATVRFACQKGFIDVTGDVKGDESVMVTTPSFEKYGAIKVQIRLKIGAKSFSNNTADFSFFSVTDCAQTVAFGPGILSENYMGKPTYFIIQAKDKFGNNRICGMDEFKVQISHESSKKITANYKIKDSNDGTYVVEYTLQLIGRYAIYLEFLGNFKGKAGEISGSSFTTTVVNGDSEKIKPELDGISMQKYVSNVISKLKSFISSTTKGIGKKVSKEDEASLIALKEHIRNFTCKTCFSENIITATQAYLSYLKRKGTKNFPNLEKTLQGVQVVDKDWSTLKAMIPTVTERIATVNQYWTEKNKFKIEAHTKELQCSQGRFRNLPFWFYTDKNGARLDQEVIQNTISEGRIQLKNETTSLEESVYLCEIFDLGELVQPCSQIVADMKIEIDMMSKLWKVNENLETQIKYIEEIKWIDVDIDSLEDIGKMQLKAVKSSHKCTKHSEAFQAIDKRCKDLLVTIPLIGLLRSKSMRSRHWKGLVKAIGKEEFTAPTEGNEGILLGDVLSLQLHSISNEVEEICDQAVKEEKIELNIGQMDTRWSTVDFTMNPYKIVGSDDEIPLLGIGEEDFEALENDQLVVQGMLASRFVAHFQSEVNNWQRALFNVNEVFTFITEIQRTWSYLEPLFIHSDEVKRELPEDTSRFASIDEKVRVTLKNAWNTRNVKDAFNEQGLLKRLEFIQEQLDMCKKSLADFLDGRRRQFPRYYFVSEADLLDILSNGSDPKKILVHIPKIYLCTKTISFSEEKTESGRPIATEFIAGVGSEVCTFEPPVPLEGKVEIYMQTILNAQKMSIFETVKRSIYRYQHSHRSKWVLAKDDLIQRPLDPAQTTLFVLAINYVNEVEQVFVEMKNGEKDAMKAYSEKQVTQLSDLIELTQTDLSKGDRTRIMVCITMDAHSRDIVHKMIRNKVEDVDSFMWQSQLKHKFRRPLSHSRYLDRDKELRGSDGERAEIAICDAILPYDYEYLGNGPRLVITPLTDRVYVTATQALNLNMGCAPAGPAGTGNYASIVPLFFSILSMLSLTNVVNNSTRQDRNYKGSSKCFSQTNLCYQL